MLKALIIANEFPPTGGAGVQRTAKFVKYLRKYGYEPIIVTKDHPGSVVDESLLNDIPKDVEIHRLKAYDTMNRTGVMRIPMKVLGSRILSPDSEFFWYYFNREKVVEIAKNNDVDVVYTTSFPYSAHLFGLYLKRVMPELPWVCDFRDEWTNNPYHLDSFSRRLKLKLEKKKEHEVTSECNYFITNTPLMLEGFLADNQKLKDKSTFIPNGYDEDDFTEVIDKRDGGDRFVITYTGSLYGRRNLDEFLEGFKLASDRGDIDPKRVAIRIVGNIYEKAITAYSEKYGLEGIISSHGYMPHKDSIQMLFNSDVILLVIGKGKGSRNFYTGKIFEYIRGNRPILAIVPEDGVAADVIRETGTGIVVDPDDNIGTADAIAKLYKSWEEGETLHNPDWNNIKKYSRETQAMKLSEIFTIAINKSSRGE